MSNIIYENEKYNLEIKKGFMDQYRIATRKTIDRIFRASSIYEEEIRKDLFDFTKEEIGQFILEFKPKSIQSANLYVSFIYLYIKWSIENDFTNNPNPLDGVTRDWAIQFIDKSKKKFWTHEEILKITVKLENAQDACIPVLYFWGVNGKSGSELLNLKMSDINANTLHLTDFDGSTRLIKVGKECIYICEAAAREMEYVKSNGNPSKNLKAKPTTDLVQNDYIIKSSITRTDHHGAADTHLLHRRLTLISKEIEEPNFKPKYLRNSGMLYLIKELYLENGKLEEEEYKKVFEHFGGFAYQIECRMKVDFLNLKTIKELYKLS